jgi:hypothetical protein
VKYLHLSFPFAEFLFVFVAFPTQTKVDKTFPNHCDNVFGFKCDVFSTKRRQEPAKAFTAKLWTVQIIRGWQGIPGSQHTKPNAGRTTPRTVGGKVIKDLGKPNVPD